MTPTATAPEEIDRSVLAYLEWRKHEDTVRVAWSACVRAPRGERKQRFAAYVEELDREQRACELLRDVLATSV